MTSPVGPHSSVNEQQQRSSSALIGSHNAAFCPLRYFFSCAALLSSTFFILSDISSAVIIARHNESKMKFVANYFDDRFVSIRCCRPILQTSSLLSKRTSFFASHGGKNPSTVNMTQIWRPHVYSWHRYEFKQMFTSWTVCRLQTWILICLGVNKQDSIIRTWKTGRRKPPPREIKLPISVFFCGIWCVVDVALTATDGPGERFIVVKYIDIYL